MPRPQSQRALARRAIPAEPRAEAVSRHAGIANAGLAALAVSVLGVGIAFNSLSTSSAQNVQPDGNSSAVVTTVTPDVKQPSAFQRDANTISRSTFRAALSDAAVSGDDESDELDAATLAAASAKAAEPAQVDEDLLTARAALLEQESEDATDRADELDRKKKAAEKKAEAAKKALGTPSMPVTSYRLVARFGDVGSWSRYHTGLDFSAPIGTKVVAPTAGVVEQAGSGGDAGGWAGTYVVLRHADGNQTLYAHMSSVSVEVGQRVTGGDRLGTVGQTGRAFGPHLHFEVYPAGIEPGDVYSAVDPRPWLSKLGLKP